MAMAIRRPERRNGAETEQRNCRVMGGRFSDRSLHLVLVVGNLIWGSEGSAALAERPSHECAETRGLRPGGARSSGHASPLDRARPRPTWPGAAPKHLARSAPLVTPRKYQSTLRKLAEVLRKPYARVEPFSGMNARPENRASTFGATFLCAHHQHQYTFGYTPFMRTSQGLRRCRPTPRPRRMGKRVIAVPAVA